METNIVLKVLLILLEILFLIFLYALNVEEKPRARKLVANMNLFLCALILAASAASLGMMVMKNNMSLALLLIPAPLLSVYILVHAYKVM